MTLLTTRDGVVHMMDGMCPRDHEAYALSDAGDPAAMVVITKCSQRIDEEDFEWTSAISVGTFNKPDAVMTAELTCTDCDAVLTLNALKEPDRTAVYHCGKPNCDTCADGNR